MADRRAEPSAQGIVGRTQRPGDHTPRRGRVRTRYEQSAAHRYGVGHLPFWADMHGQSEETIGTNSARRLAE